MINDIRQRNGCRALTEDARLDSAAAAHSADMSQRGYLSSDGYARRDEEAGYPNPYAENVAQDASDASQVLGVWMHDETERNNILNCGLVAIGAGDTTVGGYWTADFGR